MDRDRWEPALYESCSGPAFRPHRFLLLRPGSHEYLGNGGMHRSPRRDHLRFGLVARFEQSSAPHNPDMWEIGRRGPRVPSRSWRPILESLGVGIVEVRHLQDYRRRPRAPALEAGRTEFHAVHNDQGYRLQGDRERT